MASKRQLLCPIGSACRLILLNFKPDGTKIKIANHAIELVDPAYTQGMSRWWSRDSRDDICALYPMIIRFIELYLCPVRKEKKPQVVKYEATTDMSSEHANDLFGVFNQPVLKDVQTEEKTEIPSSQECCISDKSRKCLKKMAEYLCRGLSLLQKTYNYDNAVLTLQYYILLIKAGIEDSYTPSLLPTHLRDEKRNFLDPAKVRDLWDDDKIEKVCDLFVRSFEANDKIDRTMVEAYDKAIYTILNRNDELFRSIVETTIM